ncbi:MAG: RNA-binding protein [Proteobacteria bacterium]|nr:MAG: RNA-binding protein [Pseudomonadota bacterium]
MGRKLYVGNLSYSTTDESLRAAFAAFGTVDSAKVIMDRESGRSKGFGFIEMSTDEEASAAVGGLDGQEVDGRNLRVSEARPQEGGGGGGRGPRGGGGGGGFGGGGRGGGDRGGGGGYGGGGGGGRW